jgi:2-polyprenyl-3-methyl-5-hydroxy-6-metoxy-1,4-benzoquinol methylase
LSRTDELARYALHDNSLSNKGYVDFLSEVADVAVNIASEMQHTAGLPINDPMERPVKLLDFGCGRDAVLCGLLVRRGIECYPYDPLYEGLRRLPDIVDGYDIIVAGEVVEHLRGVEGELRFMSGLLREGGAIILRTRLYDDAGLGADGGGEGFKNWWYAQDPTHINFFSRKTLDRVALIVNKRIEETGRRDIFVFR